ncbi:LIC_13387 family protein [Nitriliruptor alkaliphilus]|uniref:LIC_13387 family protein n=1 Tax=Nitriliruptor alkaliphilus TaxID=427918 RepID=UPI0006975101|nr:hypothetical protein [Nitriliruptor alkaliphilus]
MVAQILLAASAGIVLFAGTLHLHGTFFGADLRPEDPGLRDRMEASSPNVTSQATMWDVWIGFNALLSLGLMLFGLLYGYLAIGRFPVLQGSVFLILVGVGFLLSSVVVWHRYTYHLPVLVFSVALILYVVGAGVALA